VRLPSIIAFQLSRATFAASSFSDTPTDVSSMSARSKNSVSVGPGIKVVMLTPSDSLISLRNGIGKAVDERLGVIIDQR
jgi:hypothetical protein